ncbi:MAG: hypothetical protein IKT58_03995 [Oscillospiraceae bacterium]|nr:hypothetical protein [Oscillospiraceae bacterium]
MANELNPDNILNGGYNTEWAENLGTDRVNVIAYNRADWEQYEKDHSRSRFQYDPSGETFDQLEDMQRWRDNSYEDAQSYTDQELAQAIAEKQAIRDDESQDNKFRAILERWPRTRNRDGENRSLSGMRFGEAWMSTTPLRRS